MVNFVSKDLIERGFRKYTRGIYYKHIGDVHIIVDLNRKEVSVALKAENILDLVTWLERLVDHMQNPEKYHKFLPRMLIKNDNIRWVGIAAEDPKPYLDFLFSVAEERGYRIRETEDLYAIEKRIHPQLNLWDPQLYITKPRKFEKDYTFFIFIPLRSELRDIPQLIQQHFSFTGIDYVKT